MQRILNVSKQCTITTLVRTMPIEVELKFPVSDLSALERQLAALGRSPLDAVDQVDRYFAHPQRDFARTDEALRLRRVGTANYITYKAAKLDTSTKTRREIEIPLADGGEAAAEATELLLALGFSQVAEVSKRRIHSTVEWQRRKVGVLLDDVVGLGNFVELEIMADDRDVPAARECLVALANHLGLCNSERRSYLELLLAAGTR
jgi:adenylate cyclase class 2